MKGFSRIDGGFVGVVHDIVENARALDDVVLGHVGRARRQPHEIFADVREDYGTVELRRLWRSLARLRGAGKVQRHGRHNEATYTRKGRA